MCGIFGYITKEGKGPNRGRLRRLALETQRRGRHAFGLAWLGRDGKIHTYKRPGPVTANLGDVDRCRGATVVIGHCRWATHGRPEDNRNNHPHPAGRGWFVHNGVVQNHAHLVRRYHLTMRTQCDSEVLGLLIAHFAGALDARAAQAVELTTGPLAIMGLWAHPGRLLIVRAGNPLCVGESAGGYYFASLPYGLPGPVTAMQDDYATVLRLDAAGHLTRGIDSYERGRV
jgi:glucosamine 6-phosphate synthetase-like amidotransferase/phosphosugar isomerase protein